MILKKNVFFCFWFLCLFLSFGFPFFIGQSIKMILSGFKSFFFLFGVFLCVFCFTLSPFLSLGKIGSLQAVSYFTKLLN